jgi:hypothetical protein
VRFFQFRNAPESRRDRLAPFQQPRNAAAVAVELTDDFECVTFEDQAGPYSVPEQEAGLDMLEIERLARIVLG